MSELLDVPGNEVADRSRKKGTGSGLFTQSAFSKALEKSPKQCSYMTQRIP